MSAILDDADPVIDSPGTAHSLIAGCVSVTYCWQIQSQKFARRF